MAITYNDVLQVEDKYIPYVCELLIDGYGGNNDIFKNYYTTAIYYDNGGYVLHGFSDNNVIIKTGGFKANEVLSAKGEYVTLTNQDIYQFNPDDPYIWSTMSQSINPSLAQRMRDTLVINVTFTSSYAASFTSKFDSCFYYANTVPKYVRLVNQQCEKLIISDMNSDFFTTFNQITIPKSEWVEFRCLNKYVTVNVSKNVIVE